MQAILDEARADGWLAFHVYDSKRSEPGFPDIVLLRNGECLVFEVKREDGRTTAAQEQWLDAFGAVPGVHSTVIRPRHWDTLVTRLRSPRWGVGEVVD